MQRINISKLLILYLFVLCIWQDKDPELANARGVYVYNAKIYIVHRRSNDDNAFLSRHAAVAAAAFYIIPIRRSWDVLIKYKSFYRYPREWWFFSFSLFLFTLLSPQNRDRPWSTYTRCLFSPPRARAGDLYFRRKVAVYIHYWPHNVASRAESFYNLLYRPCNKRVFINFSKIYK